MTLTQAQSELVIVNAAIANIGAGAIQSMFINGGGGTGRGKTVLPLKDLREWRAELEAIIERLQHGTFSVAQFRDPE